MIFDVKDSTKIDGEILVLTQYDESSIRKFIESSNEVVNFKDENEINAMVSCVVGVSNILDSFIKFFEKQEL